MIIFEIECLVHVESKNNPILLLTEKLDYSKSMKIYDSWEGKENKMIMMMLTLQKDII